VYDGVDRLEESTAPSHSPIHHRWERRKTRDGATPALEEKVKRAVVSLIPAVLFVLFMVYLATRRSDDEEEPSGHGWTILHALIDLLSWR
jgi:hypothetical protein